MPVIDYGNMVIFYHAVKFFSTMINVDITVLKVAGEHKPY